MSAQTEQPLVPNHVGFNDAHTILDAQTAAANPQTKSKIETRSENTSERVAEVNIGNERRNSIVREVEVGERDEDEERTGGGGGGAIGGEGQKAMREGKQVI